MNRPVPIHLVIAGGGTGGHLFPGLAVARRLLQEVPGARVTFAGSGRPLERRHVRAAGFDYLALPCGALPRRPWQVPGFVVRNLVGYLAARRLLRQEHAHAVIGLGGFASVPMARAAVGLRVPLILLEQNALPGRANRWLARSADAVCLTLESAAEHLPRDCRLLVTGNPLRPEFVGAGRRPAEVVAGAVCVSGEAAGVARPLNVVAGSIDDRPVLRARQLLILGGSGGARSLNENVPRALAALGVELAGWSVVHQSGEADFSSTRRRYRQLGVAATVQPFIADMPEVLAATDLAVCRAGGTTLSELAACGVPGLVLPYPHAADDHQRHNAESYASGGGCLVFNERFAGGRLDQRLAETLAGLLPCADRRRAMSESMLGLARPRAAEDVVAIVRRSVKATA